MATLIDLIKIFWPFFGFCIFLVFASALAGVVYIGQAWIKTLVKRIEHRAEQRIRRSNHLSYSTVLSFERMKEIQKRLAQVKAEGPSIYDGINSVEAKVAAQTLIDQDIKALMNAVCSLGEI